jgi:hypothetical protein
MVKNNISGVVKGKKESCYYYYIYIYEVEGLWVKKRRG